MAAVTNKTVVETLHFAALVASKQGWALNPDRELVEILAEGLTKNHNRYGYYSCPCREADGVRSRDADIICPCAYCRPDQEEHGYCYCGLYLTKEYSRSGKTPHSMPERRPRR